MSHLISRCWMPNKPVFCCGTFSASDILYIIALCSKGSIRFSLYSRSSIPHEQLLPCIMTQALHVVNRAEATFKWPHSAIFWKFSVAQLFSHPHPPPSCRSIQCQIWLTRRDTEKITHELVTLSTCLHPGLTMLMQHQLWKGWFFAETESI